MKHCASLGTTVCNYLLRTFVGAPARVAMCVCGGVRAVVRSVVLMFCTLIGGPVAQRLAPSV